MLRAKYLGNNINFADTRVRQVSLFFVRYRYAAMHSASMSDYKLRAIAINSEK